MNTKTLRQVIILSPHKFTGEFWKKLLNNNKIEALYLESFIDFSHHLKELRPEILLVDLKFTNAKDFKEGLLKEISGFEDVKKVFMGSLVMYESEGWIKDTGAFLQTPIAIDQTVERLKEFSK